MRTVSLMLLLPIGLPAQNLIGNASFETENYCEANIPCSPSAWYSVSEIPYGYQESIGKGHKGKRALGFMIACRDGIRSYWQTKLLCTTVKDEQYEIRFWVASNGGSIPPGSFGLSFESSPIFALNDTILHQAPDLLVESGGVSERWSAVTLRYTAKGTEKYIILGNFSTLSNKEQTQVEGGRDRPVEIFIDEVVMEPLKKQSTACEDFKRTRDSLAREGSRHTFMRNYTPVTTYPRNSREKEQDVKAVDTIIVGEVNFAFGSHELINDAIISRYFEDVDVLTIAKIDILGFSDSIGGKNYNVSLSKRRAHSVQRFLTEVLHLPAHLMTVEGRGVSTTETEIAKNRKVEIFVQKRVN